MSFNDWLGGGPLLSKDTTMQLKLVQEAVAHRALVNDAIEKIDEYARNNIPTPGVGGDLYMGFPINDLLKVVHRDLRPPVLSEIARRRGWPTQSGASMKAQSPPRVYTYKEKMEMRMGWQPGEHEPFVFVEYRSVQDTAFMWILTTDAQSVVLEDDAALFPSDALITKVRLLGGTNG
jgi:hypothetical protein